MRIAICGKGGVGKSSLAVILSLAFLGDNYKVLAIDADSSPHLARLFEIEKAITPLAEMMDLLAERAEKAGPFYSLNPKIEDLPEKMAVYKDGLRLMILGAIRSAGAGCACPEQTVLRRLLTYLLLTSKEVVIVDMEAGVEHFGRGTVTPIDVILIVTQPFKGSLETSKQILKLSQELNLKNFFIIGNRIKEPSQEEKLKEEFGDCYLLSFPLDEELEKRELEGRGLWDYRGPLLERAKILKSLLMRLVNETS